MTENTPPLDTAKKNADTLRAIGGGLLGFAAYKLVGLAGAVVVILFMVLHEWGETRPWARWGSLAASFTVGTVGVLWGAVAIDLNPGPEPDLFTVIAFSASLTLWVCSALLAPFYGIRAALRRRSGGAASPLQTGDDLMRSVHRDG